MRRTGLHAWVLVALLAAGLSGCGRKASPKPPEAIPPRPITDLQAESQVDGMLLQWSRPRYHADGAALDDLGSFSVERASIEGTAAFVAVATLTVADQQRFSRARTFRYLDQSVADGATYVYRVIAATIDDYRSETSNVVTIAYHRPAQPAGAGHDRGKSPDAAATPKLTP